MRILLLILTSTLASCGTSSSENHGLLKKDQKEAFESLLTSFDTFLESNYAKYGNTKQQYDAFLSDFGDYYFYPDQEKSSEPTEIWEIEPREVIEIVRDMERTKMRHEIMLYPHETYKPQIEKRQYADKELLQIDTVTATFDDNLEDMIIPISPDYSELTEDEFIRYQAEQDSIFKAVMDSSMRMNRAGLYLHLLLTEHSDDMFVRNYVELYDIENNISPAILADGIKTWIVQAKTINRDALRTITAVEFYYWILITIKRNQ